MSIRLEDPGRDLHVFHVTPGVKSGWERRGFGRLGYYFPTRQSPFRERSADSVQNSLFGPKLSSRRGEMGGKGNPTAISHTCEGPIEENSMISRNELGGSKWRSTDKNNGF